MIDLSDVTFTIPLKYDSVDRISNLRVLLTFFNENIKTNLILLEQGETGIFYDKIKDIFLSEHVFLFWKNSDSIFYRTKILNILAKRANTPIIVNYDVDVILSPQQYESAANKIRDNELDLCTAFDTYTYNVPKSLHSKIIQEKNISWLTQDMCDCPHKSEIAKGGVVFWDKKKFIAAGMENENMVSWGPEDQERVYRAQKLDYKWGRVNGILFHLDHSRSTNSNNQHNFFLNNEHEFEKIKSMTKEQLLSYVGQWNWCKQ